ncbi:subtilisin-like protein [Terfezia boudieri ATCC MYA-4762]|uniref:Subtilisin-like protein n=1 Tax=Terfezia boudieri ATCC MYA-4762 TaxID=1051890 RepID=A0A3N4LQ26_9PEZI|nr:subtilisin-like protein [Terfezia boudieri ATCC MYA-4762]
MDETPGSGGDYVVLVDDEDPRSIEQLIQELGGSMDTVKYVYNNTHFKGFAASMSKHCVTQLSTFGGIKHYEEKAIFKAFATEDEAPWGLNRISKTGAVKGQGKNVLDLTFTYTFDESPGAGVDIYIVDTGIDTKHIDFNGRAEFGFSFDNENIDGNGHGTHCAGTSASTTLGIAKNANLIAVKVLGDDGSGGNDDILAGLDFVAQRHEQRKTQANFKGSVISMSLGSDQRSRALDQAVQAASRRGIHVSVAAGNDGQDACNSSPGFSSSQSSVISVGAIDINDQRASFSNFGECVTTYAPGVDIVSTFIDPSNPRNGRNNIINNLSGTSMACPHVTGLIAYYLGKFPELATDTAKMKQLIIDASEKIAGLANIPGDPARIVNNLGQLNPKSTGKREETGAGFKSWGRKRAARRE